MKHNTCSRASVDFFGSRIQAVINLNESILLAFDRADRVHGGPKSPRHAILHSR